MTNQALAGVRVVESSAFVAAPLCGLLLSQYGADVIRIDNIGGGIDYRRLPRSESGRSFYWTSLNKNKRSVAVNLRQPEGRELVRRLVSAPGPEGGILLTNVAAPWLSHQLLQEARRDVISCTIEGNFDGTTAVDYTVQCATGYPHLTGEAGAGPINNPLPAWDVICAHQACSALLASIVRRSVSQDGSEIRIALSDIAFSTMSHLGLISEAQLGTEERGSIGNYIFGAFGRDFGTADGKRVMVAAISARQWSSLVAACELAEPLAALEARLSADFSREEDRYEHREPIAELVGAWCSNRSFDVISAAFDRHNVCWGAYQTVKEMVTHDPRISVDNPLFQTLDTPGIGKHLAAGPAFRIVDEPRSEIRSARFLGGDTERVLGEVLGIGRAGLDDLVSREIVAGPDRDPHYGR
jgi:2-methylfumaryl-CoA isomerase